MINTATWPNHKPLTDLLLLVKYQETPNPVTRYSLRKCIEDRIARGKFG